MKNKYLLLLIFISCNNLKYNLNKSHKESGTLNLYKKLEPKGKKTNKIVEYTHYKLSFSKKDKQPEWVYYMLTSKMTEKNISRTDDFREDKNVEGCATLKDYYKSGYDRGHLLPAGDMTFDKTAMSETFFLTNMSPQTPSFNRGKWVGLETKVREWVQKYDTLFVVTAGNLKNNIGEIGEGVTIPKSYYKIILIYKNNIKKGIAFSMENKSLNNDLHTYSKSIRDIEKSTGIDFFYKLPLSIQDNIENQNDYSNW